MFELFTFILSLSYLYIISRVFNIQNLEKFHEPKTVKQSVNIKLYYNYL